MAGIQPGGQPPGPQQSSLPTLPGPGAPMPAPAPPFSPGWWEQRRSQYPRRARRLIALAIILLPTVALLAALFIVGQFAPSSSAQSPAPLVNVTVQLLGATCQDRGVDLSCVHRFYLLGALVAPDPASPEARVISQAQVTPPMEIGSGKAAMFSGGNQLLFVGMVSPGAALMGGLVAYDDMKGLNTTMLSTWSGQVAGDVAAQLQQKGITSGNLESRSSAKQILGFAAKAWLARANLDSDSAEMLGRQQLTIPATGGASEPKSLELIQRPNASSGEGSDYTVQYQITRSPVSPAALARQAHRQPMSEQEALTRTASAATILAIAGDVPQMRRNIYITPTHPGEFFTHHL